MRRTRRNHSGHPYEPQRPYNNHDIRLAEEVLKMDDRTADISEMFGGLSKKLAQQIIHETTGRKPKENPMRRNPDKSQFTWIVARNWRLEIDSDGRVVVSSPKRKPFRPIMQENGSITYGVGNVPCYLRGDIRRYFDWLASRDQKSINDLRTAGRYQRRNPRRSKNFTRQRIWRTSKRGAKASKRGRRKYKLKHGGRAIFAYPRGRKGSRKIYELLIPRGSRRSRSRK